MSSGRGEINSAAQGCQGMSATARIQVIVKSSPPSRLTDVELMRACGSPDFPDAWDEFVRRFNRFVCVAVVRAYSQCSGRRPGQLDPETIADLVQDVYMKLLERSTAISGAFRGESDAAVFVYIGRVAISVAVDAQRRHLARKRGRDVLSLDAVVARDDDEDFTIGMTMRAHEPSPEQNAMATLLRREVAELLRGIARGRNAARDFRIAEGYILDGDPLTEIAAELGGVGSGAMKSSLRRTTAKLRLEIARRERAATLRQAQVS